jgi:hypothetical protein
MAKRATKNLRNGSDGRVLTDRGSEFCGKYCFGKTPLQTFIDAASIAHARQSDSHNLDPSHRDLRRDALACSQAYRACKADASRT